MLKRIICLAAAFALSLACFMSSSLGMEEEDIDMELLFPTVDDTPSRDKKDSDGSYLMTITCAGDFTIGKDMNHKDIFGAALKKHDGDVNFVMQNVRDIFLDDDLTLINFEGTLTNSTYKPKSKTKDDFIFSAPPEWVSVLPDNGVEAVSLDNNHVRDHGEEGLRDTIDALSGAGVIYSYPLESGVFNYKGEVLVCMLSYNCIDRYGEDFHNPKYQGEYSESFLSYTYFEDAVKAEIEAAKKIYPLVIVSFHWGIELWNKPTVNQIRMGHAAIDAGADLVVGTHSHRLQPIEVYKDKFIIYSLGNFCFAGNKKPSDMSSILFQIRYRVKEGKIFYKDFRIIPIRISSTRETNDFIPTVLEDYNNGAAIDAILNIMRDPQNTKGLDTVVTDFPMAFD